MYVFLKYNKMILAKIKTLPNLGVQHLDMYRYHFLSFLNSYFHSVNIGTKPRFFTGKKSDNWDNSFYVIQVRIVQYHVFIKMSFL